MNPSVVLALDLAAIVTTLAAAWFWFVASRETHRRISREEQLDAADFTASLSASTARSFSIGRRRSPAPSQPDRRPALRHQSLAVNAGRGAIWSAPLRKASGVQREATRGDPSRLERDRSRMHYVPPAPAHHAPARGGRHHSRHWPQTSRKTGCPPVTATTPPAGAMA